VYECRMTFSCARGTVALVMIDSQYFLVLSNLTHPQSIHADSIIVVPGLIRRSTVRMEMQREHAIMAVLVSKDIY